MRQILQNATAILLQKCDNNLLQNTSDFFKKLRQLYYQMWHFLQYATFITKCIDTLRKPLIENDLPTLYINNFEITRESITKSLGIYI